METITPYGDYTLVPAEDVARLEALAERLGLHPEALDDAVHDVCDRAAAHIADEEEDTFGDEDEDEEHRDRVWDEVSGTPPRSSRCPTPGSAAATPPASPWRCWRT